MKQTFLSALLFLLLFSCSRENKSVQSKTKDETVTAPSHIIVVFLENHSFDDIIGNAAADYINSLADSGYLFKNFHGIDHPSQPNYIGLFGGSQYGVTNDQCLANKLANSKLNLYTQLNAVGKTLGYYSEDLPGNPTKCKSGSYVRKHNASSDFNNVPNAVNKNLTQLPTNFALLENVVFIVPNLDHDMHNGSISTADNWLQTNLGSLATWCKTNNSLFIVIWDEDNNTPQNHIPCILYGQNVNNSSDSVNYDHINLTKTIASLEGVTNLSWTTELSSRTVITGF